MRKQTTSKDFSEYFNGRQSKFFEEKDENWTPFDSCDLIDETEDLMEDKVLFIDLSML